MQQYIGYLNEEDSHHRVLHGLYGKILVVTIQVEHQDMETRERNQFLVTY